MLCVCSKFILRVHHRKIFLKDKSFDVLCKLFIRGKTAPCQIWASCLDHRFCANLKWNKMFEFYTWASNVSIFTITCSYLFSEDFTLFTHSYVIWQYIHKIYFLSFDVMESIAILVYVVSTGLQYFVFKFELLFCYCSPQMFCLLQFFFKLCCCT